ncbi:MAG: hypothetical protein HOW73_45350 [Polyangiaceae bacterium]|nr:hypothetical protein [Polyangiaceae bacterium]
MKRRLRWVLHVVLAALGILAVVLLVRHVGARQLLEAMKQCAPVLPIVFALEMVRTMTDAWRTQLLYDRSGKHVPMRRVLPVQIAAYPMTLFLPAGGAASEAYKAAVLARDVTAPVAAAAATTNQALQLFAVFVVSIPCTIVAYLVWGMSGFTAAIIVQALTAIGLAIAIQIATRHRLLGALAAKVSTKAGAAVDSHRDAVRVLSFVPMRPLFAAITSRIAQLIQVGLLVVFAGATPWLSSSFLALGVQLVSGAAGDLVPAQIGATDASFALAAKPLGIDQARALSIAMAMHVVQIGWALLALLLGLRQPRRVEVVEEEAPVIRVS